MMTFAEIKEVLTGSEINLVKMNCQDFNINGEERVQVLQYCAENRKLIFGGSDPVLTSSLVRRACQKAMKITAAR